MIVLGSGVVPVVLGLMVKVSEGNRGQGILRRQ